MMVIGSDGNKHANCRGSANTFDCQVPKYNSYNEAEKEEIDEYLSRKDLTIHDVQHANSPNDGWLLHTLCENKGTWFDIAFITLN